MRESAYASLHIPTHAKDREPAHANEEMNVNVIDQTPPKATPHTPGDATGTGTNAPLDNTPVLLACDGEMENATGINANALTHLKLPPFWKENPTLWFTQIEMAFDIYRINSDKTKFNYTVLNLDQAVMSFVSDIVRRPPENDKYETLKRRIISTFDETTESKLRKMLRGRELGEEKPSHFLQWLRNLSGEQVGNDVLRTLFLEHMPQNVRGILAAATDQELSQLAGLADRVVEAINPTTQVATVSQTTEQPQVAGGNLINEVKQLKDQMEALSLQLRQSRNRSRERSRTWRNKSGQRRSTSRSRERTPNPTCYYHRKFGNQARYCRKPCDFKPALPAPSEN